MLSSCMSSCSITVTASLTHVLVQQHAQKQGQRVAAQEFICGGVLGHSLSVARVARTGSESTHRTGCPGLGA